MGRYKMIVFILWFEDESCLICVRMSLMDLTKLVLTLLIYLLFPSLLYSSPLVPLKTKQNSMPFVAVTVQFVFG